MSWSRNARFLWECLSTLLTYLGTVIHSSPPLFICETSRLKHSHSQWSVCGEGGQSKNSCTARFNSQKKSMSNKYRFSSSKDIFDLLWTRKTYTCARISWLLLAWPASEVDRSLQALFLLLRLVTVKLDARHSQCPWSGTTFWRAQERQHWESTTGASISATACRTLRETTSPWPTSWARSVSRFTLNQEYGFTLNEHKQIS